MQGAIKTARYGFPVTADLVRYMASATAGSTSNFLVDDPNWAIDFAPNGTLLPLWKLLHSVDPTLSTLAPSRKP
jgi:gamma-glutamyltranspeptidase/glutathione hydrolase